MIIDVHPHFKKNFKKRVLQNRKLTIQVQDRLKLFQANPANPLLKDHSLSGDMQGFRSFSITGDIRIVYFLQNNTIWLYDIGTHNQVY